MSEKWEKGGGVGCNIWTVLMTLRWTQGRDLSGVLSTFSTSLKIKMERKNNNLTRNLKILRRIL